MPQSYFADVVTIPPIPGRETLTYTVPEQMKERLRPGSRVLVPVGRRQRAGIVVGTHRSCPDQAAGLALKPLNEVLDAEPAVTGEILELCRWAAGYYCTTLGEILAAALPPGLKLSTQSMLKISLPLKEEHLARLSRQERALLERLAQRRSLSTRSLRREENGDALRRAAASLVAKGLIEVGERTRGRGNRQVQQGVFKIAQELSPSELDALQRRARLQYRVYKLLRESKGPLPAAQLSQVASASARRALLSKGIIATTEPESVEEGLKVCSKPHLTGEQEKAVEAVTSLLAARRFSTFLLHGVTGSGKTEVYLRATEEAVNRGLGVVILVPEIGLTHQLEQRVQERFVRSLAIVHSGLSRAERQRQWRRISQGEARIVVGARSAVFAPVCNLGLIVVDEEHDGSYKQEEAPRYNARDLAIVRAQKRSCPVLLGSATPSLESFCNARQGRYKLLTLSRRVLGRGLPEVEIVDLRQRSRSGGPGRDPDDAAFLLSPLLVEELTRTLDAGEQSLLFLNRRGFANYLQCVHCGEPLSCPNCSVTMTLHASRRLLICHHCNHSQPTTQRCPSCDEEALRPLGSGTERIEAALARLLPQARIARLDRDATVRRGTQKAILEKWREHQVDILVGTQMVTKGHDVPGVTLVGVLLADVALGMPDFRAAERTFQLLAQVAGRAGRGSQPGKVIIQTFRPNHPSIRAARTHDYMSFATAELAERKSLGYPPFGRTALLRVDSTEPGQAEEAAATVGKWCRSRAERTGSLRVLGPAPAPIERLRGRWRWNIMLQSAQRPVLSQVVREVARAWQSSSLKATTRLVIDVDPLSML